MTMPESSDNEYMMFLLGVVTAGLAAPHMRELGIKVVDVSLDALWLEIDTSAGRLRITIQSVNR